MHHILFKISKILIILSLGALLISKSKVDFLFGTPYRYSILILLTTISNKPEAVEAVMRK